MQNLRVSNASDWLLARAGSSDWFGGDLGVECLNSIYFIQMKPVKSYLRRQNWADSIIGITYDHVPFRSHLLILKFLRPFTDANGLAWSVVRATSAVSSQTMEFVIPSITTTRPLQKNHFKPPSQVRNWYSCFAFGIFYICGPHQIHRHPLCSKTVHLKIIWFYCRNQSLT
jgi:hypothetical protein